MLLLGTTMAFAASLPTAPQTIDVPLSTSFNEGNYGPQEVNATAGNITALVINGIGQTKAWQGYYGNITGTITLDDVNNYTFYNWSTVEPQGQIYATLSTTVSWLDVNCFNFAEPAMSETTIESYYSIQTDDVDGVPETFNSTDHPSFEVGSKQFVAVCPTTYIFQNDAYQQANFVNVLLWDQSNNVTGWIYTALIEDKTPGAVADLVCYNNEYCDFQILVNENGHGTDTNPTPYYFWVELL
jgi:hypothetical protein